MSLIKLNMDSKELSKSGKTIMLAKEIGISYNLVKRKE